MAVDTKEKRLSMMNFATGGDITLPEADGAIDNDDKQHLLECYSGIAFDPPAGPVVSVSAGRNLEWLLMYRTLGLR